MVVDGYHGFMATPTDLSAVADKIFYLSGGYKYAMSGEGAGILHAPDGYCMRPVATGWFAEFGNLMGPPDSRPDRDPIRCAPIRPRTGSSYCGRRPP